MATVNEALVSISSAKNTMIVAQLDGRLYTVDFTDHPELDYPDAVNWDISVSKVILAKVQHSRTRHQTLEEIEFENVYPTGQVPAGYTGDYEITVFGKTDGGAEDLTVSPTVVQEEEGYIRAVCRATAKNFSIQLRGTYTLNTIALTYHLHGKR